MNHFSKVCRSKPINRSRFTRPRKPSKGKQRARFVDIEDSSGGETSTLAGAGSDDSEEYTLNIGAQEPHTAKPIFQLRIMDTPIRIMADSGATVNILSKRDFDSLKPKPQLLNTKVRVYPYMSAKLLDLCGKLRANVVSDR